MLVGFFCVNIQECGHAYQGHQSKPNISSKIRCILLTYLKIYFICECYLTCFLKKNLNITEQKSIFVPGYLGIMITRQQQFCCIFAATKDKFGYFLKKLFHSSTSHTYHHNSSLFLSRHKNIYGNGRRVTFPPDLVVVKYILISECSFPLLVFVWQGQGKVLSKLDFCGVYQERPFVSLL